MVEINNHCSGKIPPGFFSNFFIVLDWIHNSMYNQEKIFVNWNCGDLDNIWPTLFEQPKFDKNELSLKINNFRCQYDNKFTINNINEVLPVYNKYNGWFYNNVNFFYDENFQNFRDEFHKSFSTLEINKNIIEKVDEFTKNFDDDILGITVRIPSHYTLDKTDGIPLSNIFNVNDFYEKISEEVICEFNTKKYKKIFVCCDVQYFIDLLVEKVGSESVIYTNYNRIQSLDEDWVVKGLQLRDEYKLVLVDCLILSKCSYIIGGSSNIFLGSLIMNKNLEFGIFDFLKKSYGL
jgi:hypothetical protein